MRKTRWRKTLLKKGFKKVVELDRVYYKCDKGIIVIRYKDNNKTFNNGQLILKKANRVLQWNGKYNMGYL